MNKMNKKGFTLAELLIVVAIIAVLVAIAIPVFTTQLERSREATDLSNIRSAYAEAMSDFLANGADSTASAVVTTIQQQTEGWDIDDAALYTRVNGTESKIDLASGSTELRIKKGATVTVTVDADGSVTVTN